MKVLPRDCKRKKRQKPKRRKKKVINDKFFNTSRLLLFLLLLKGRCQINHISIGPLQRIINSNFLKTFLAFIWVSPAPLILECAIFTTKLFQNKCNKSRWQKSHKPNKKCGWKSLFQSISVFGKPDKTL